MGKHEQVKELAHITTLYMRAKGFHIPAPFAAQLGEYLYHREIGWKKVIQCLLNQVSRPGAAEITLAQMCEADGKIAIKNVDGITIQIGAGIIR